MLTAVENSSPVLTFTPAQSGAYFVEARAVSRSERRAEGEKVMDFSKKGLTSNERFDSAIISRAEPSRAEPSRAEPSRAEPSRAEPSRAVKSASLARVLLPTTA